MSKLYISYKVIGFDLDPDEISHQAGLSPSKTWKKGDLVSDRAIVRYKRNGWQVASGLGTDSDFRDHIRALIEKLTPHRQILIEFAKLYYVELSCVIYMDQASDNPRPYAGFEPDEVAFFAELGVHIDFDLYAI